ncbi:MAG: serpin family protein [Clostridia bacterium]|nr:serpin family protein [Clostridia bacterium]
MKHTRIIAALLASCSIACTSCGSAENLMKAAGLTPTVTIPDAPADDYSHLDAFTGQLWSTVCQKMGDENILISPLSAYIALMMCANGAEGDTLAAFGLDEAALDGINADIAALVGWLADNKGSTDLTVANSVWVQEGYEVSPTYLGVLADSFAAEAFSADLPSSVGKVNSWIEDKTRGLIKDMLDKIEPDTVMLLINALYMKAMWDHDFDADDTYDQTFTAWDGSFATTEFMHNGTRNEQIIDNDDMVGIVMPYDDEKLAMVAVMPQSEDVHLDELSAMFDITNGGKYSFKGLADSAKSERTRLSFPKFTVETSVTLSDVLCGMGLEIAFTDAADFSKMSASGEPELFIGDVLQNAKIIVDEEGTEAAAATVIMVDATSAFIEEKEPRVLEFNRPFIYAVIDQVSGAVLFCGQYNTAR